MTDAERRAEALDLLWKALRFEGYVRPSAVPGYVFATGPHGESVAFPTGKNPPPRATAI